MIILVQARKAYGQVRYYPVNNVAIELSKLTQTSTFTFYHLMIAKRMGASLELADRSHAPDSDPEELQYRQLFGKE